MHDISSSGFTAYGRSSTPLSEIKYMPQRNCPLPRPWNSISEVPDGEHCRDMSIVPPELRNIMIQFASTGPHMAEA
ncbi:hypothetical protein N7539_007552 [Penicillium diatomitis]|uniref:Uncharacterized protein n=1 Tax=Penicillium diatomitis TaxID=2819901 RepID=A0A9W9WVB4_9EURO|nr:uncharacterized protein N7539_007552 [Penicillium diatomitis]KAJ5477408.1 hypothetical protein N7539_007552 [Penicillium diatomitis]